MTKVLGVEAPPALTLHPQLRVWCPPCAGWGWQGEVPQFPRRSLPQAPPCVAPHSLGAKSLRGELGQQRVLTPLPQAYSPLMRGVPAGLR